MSKTMLIYNDVTSLSREEHQSLKLKPIESFAFASGMHWSPVAGPEFAAAARHYPIVFIRENSDATITPVLLLGFESGQNCYLDAADQWLADTYVPAFIRRYPLVLAETGQDDEVIVCFDRACANLNETDGLPLFNDDGTNSAKLDDFIRFMNDYRAGMKATAEFVALLERFDLFEETTFNIQAADGTTLTLENILVVSEGKFAKAFGAQLAQLNSSGFLMWILAHQLSLANLPQLLNLQVACRKRHDETNLDAADTDAAPAVTKSPQEVN